MKITAQEEYGLRCILQLAAQPAGAPLTVGEIARREGLSVAYVEKLLRILARAELVRSHRGTKGGYELRRPCEEISLGNVARALGGVQSSQEICERHTGNLSSCVHEGNCDLRPVWQGVVDYVLDAMDAISLAQILEKGSLDRNLIMVRLPVMNAEAA